MKSITELDRYCKEKGRYLLVKNGKIKGVYPQPKRPNEVLVIDLELIKSLKYQGKHQEAQDLLEAFRKNGREGKEQLRKELLHQNYQVCKVVGMCTMCTIREAEKPKFLCVVCKDNHKTYAKRKKEGKVNPQWTKEEDDTLVWIYQHTKRYSSFRKKALKDFAEQCKRSRQAVLQRKLRLNKQGRLKKYD